jgi:hypothetical protein
VPVETSIFIAYLIQVNDNNKIDHAVFFIYWMDEHRLHDAVLLVALQLAHDRLPDTSGSTVVCETSGVTKSRYICASSGLTIKPILYMCYTCEKRFSACLGCYAGIKRYTCDLCEKIIITCDECKKQHGSWTLLRCDVCMNDICKECAREMRCYNCDTEIRVCESCCFDDTVCGKCE